MGGLGVWLIIALNPTPGCPETPPNIKTPAPPKSSFYIRRGGGLFNIGGKGVVVVVVVVAVAVAVAVVVVVVAIVAVETLVTSSRRCRLCRHRRSYQPQQ